MLRTSENGLTLVEVAVSLAIVAILASLLMPAFTHARDTARCVRCQATMRQWSTALSIYMANHESFIPRRGQGVRPLKDIQRDSDWFNCLPQQMGMEPYRELIDEGRRPQAREDSMFICPSAIDPGGKYFLAYGMNMYLSPWIRPEPHQISQIPEPSHVVFMADAPGPYSAAVPSAEGYSVVARHRDSANLLFLDGHVMKFSGEYLGCGSGDPEHANVRWQTGSKGVNQTPLK